jgi:hypothetical protein
VTAGFRREVDENCALLEHYAESRGNFLPTFRYNLSGPIFRVYPIGFPETSGGNYHYSLRNDPEECSSHLKWSWLNGRLLILQAANCAGRDLS